MIHTLENYRERFKPDIASYSRKDLPVEWLEILYEKKWFKLFIPRRLGGLECSLNEGLEILILSAAIHGSLGWVVNLGSGAGYFYPFFERAVAEKLYGEKTSVIAGSGRTEAQARRVEGGYLLRGTWDKCSGAAHATHFSVSATLEDGSRKSFILSPGQVRLHDRWAMFGLKASSSFALVAENALVPEEYAFEIGRCKLEDQYPLHHLPFEEFARFCMAASLLGMVNAFLYHLEKSELPHSSNFEASKKKLEGLAENFTRRLEELAGERWAALTAGTKAKTTPQYNIKSLVDDMAHTLYSSCCDLFYEGSMQLADESALAHQAFRDVLLAGKHFMLR